MIQNIRFDFIDSTAEARQSAPGENSIRAAKGGKQKNNHEGELNYSSTAVLLYYIIAGLESDVR